MPVYEYVCLSCSHAFEEFTRSMSDREGLCCPKCSDGNVERKLSVFAAREGATKSASLPAGGPCDTCSGPGGSCPFA